MLGVDRLDQRMSYYSLGRKSVRWWRKVFFWVMEVVVVNSYILYSRHTSSHRKLPHKEFRREVVMSLCEPLYNSAPTRERVQLDMSMECLRGRHFIDGGGPRRDCRVCSKRGVPGQRHLTTTFCITCSDHPPLCLGECYRMYHTIERLQ